MEPLGPEVLGSLPNAQTVSPYWLNMVEGYREYDEGQQTYQVYKYEWIGGMVNAPEPNKMCFGSKNANSKNKRTVNPAP